MAHHLLEIFLALLPAGLVYLFYSRYFIFRPRYSEHTRFLLYGILLASVSLLMIGFFFSGRPSSGPIEIGFLRAALPEKLPAFFVIYFLISSRRNSLIIIDAIITSMLLGVGFSALENLRYAFSHQPSVIFIRYLSAVPLHAVTSGIMGYLIALSISSDSVRRKVLYLVSGFFFPYVVHGLFDTVLFIGGSATFMIGPLLVAIVSFLEFEMSRARTLPPVQWLDAMGLTFDEWKILQKEPQYERWILRSMGSKSGTPVPFFQWHLDAKRILYILVILILSSGYFYLRRGGELEFVKGLRFQEELTLFAVLPLFSIFNMVMVGAINPHFFQNNLIRIPIISDVEIFYGGKRFSAITYDINSRSCLVKGPESIPRGQKVRLFFQVGKRESPSLEAEVVWDHYQMTGKSGGILLRFRKLPQGFTRFLMGYALFRISRGLTFMMKLPGFHQVRRLFVRPVSVMQTEKRVRAGTILFEEGDEGKSFYLIHKGEVEIYKTTERGERIVMAVLGENDIFGEMAVVGNRHRAAGALCKSDCILAVAESDNLDALIESNPEFTSRLIQTLSHRIFRSEQIMKGNIENLEKMLIFHGQARYAGLVLLLTGAGHNAEDQWITIPMDLERLSDEFEISKATIYNLLAFLTDTSAISELARKGLEDEETLEAVQFLSLHGLTLQEEDHQRHLNVENEGDEEEKEKKNEGMEEDPTGAETESPETVQHEALSVEEPPAEEREGKNEKTSPKRPGPGEDIYAPYEKYMI